MLSEAKHLTFPLKGRLREESPFFKYMRPFTEFTLRLFTSFRVTIEGFGVTRKIFFQLPTNLSPEFRGHVTAVGANASMSAATSTMTGRSALSARWIAGASSTGFSTLIPSAPISSATRAKLTIL